VQEFGDEEVKGNTELREACHPEEHGGRLTEKNTSGAQGGGGQLSSELTAAVVGLLVVSTLFGNFGW
jgi:hypothetical protein